MAKRIKEAALGSRTARMKLAGRKKPYFRLLSEGLHLGYRRSTVAGRAGTWLCRRYLGDERYELHLLGTADDLTVMPPGADVLTFDQAQAAARDWARSQTSAAQADAERAASPTVRSVVAAYVAGRAARDAKAGRDAELRLGHHVLASSLAELPLLSLTEDDLNAWREGLRRGGRAARLSNSPLATATLARLLNDFRAALTAAARKAKAPSGLLTTIKDGLRAPEAPDRARPKQVLADADVRRLVEVAIEQDADFGALVMVLAATGARLDQVARITVSDFQPEARRVMVPTSRKGRGQKQVTHVAVPLPDDVIARLHAIAAGRTGHEPLLLRWHHRQIAGDRAAGLAPRWEREGRRSWSMSSQLTRPWRATVAAARLPNNLVPYCLRHSSIVRGLRVGLPVRLVGAVHDTSAAMIEKHYGAFIVDATEDLLRRAIMPLAPARVVTMPVHNRRAARG